MSINRSTISFQTLVEDHRFCTMVGRPLHVRRGPSWLLLLVWLLVPLSSPAQPAQGAEVVRIGVNSDSYPYSFIGDDGVLQGFAVDLTEALERTMHLKFERRPGKSAEVLRAFESGEVEVLQSLSHVPEREGMADFSVPYLDLVGAIIVRKGDQRMMHLNDLRGKKVLVHPKSVGETVLLRHGMKDSIVYATSVTEAMRQLDRGEADATLATRLTAMCTARRLGLKNVEAVGESIEGFRARYCYGVRPGNKRLLAKINEGLAVLHASGEFDRIYDKWFGNLIPRGYSKSEIALAISAGLAVALMVALYATVRTRRLSRKVRDSESLYRSLFQKSPEALLVLGPSPENPREWLVEQVNPEAKRLFGLGVSQGLGEPLSQLLVGEPALLTKLELVLKERGSLILDHDRSRGDCISLWRVSLVPAESRMLLVIGDLSEVKAAEERLRKSEEQLRQAQKLEAIGTLASGIAHDFNNILTSILGNAELVRMDAGDKQAVQQGVGEILTASERARMLVRQILTFSRKAEARREAVDIGQVVDEALLLLRPASPASVEISHHVEAGLPRVLGDATQLNQVIMNLCTNAVHALKGRNGLLELREERVDVDPESAQLYPGLREGPHVRITIRDTGCGMSQEVLQRIYEPFFTTKAPGEGTGLGLSVVHGIVKSHGGALTVYSQPGQGTVFRVYLPVPGNLPENLAQPPGSGVVRGDGELVLLVDDERTITRVVSGMLERLGYRVTAFNTPREALAAFNRSPDEWNLVLSDLTMPGMGGLELAEKIFAQRPGIAFVLTSGFIGEEVMVRAQSLCIRHILDKPIALIPLSQCLSRALRGES